MEEMKSGSEELLNSGPLFSPVAIKMSACSRLYFEVEHVGMFSHMFTCTASKKCM